ncbi:HIT family protein [Microbacterium ulmi]|uniref:Diadenosine tetraphosphate (Ap4A) hydrolase n=1 Tax=Microbacterium ulmi TaxID=179095 RepID=A0A7Y2Q2K4_9MICO|nr:hypothetical protein [Microbacterium ulmi]NII69098.1 diadenosine tetraphosphate (Ap4A) HIT family hydrolase [Microbacterium ulmi]NNH04708.1 hypothetical protein [Microbacterium ulmi]
MSDDSTIDKMGPAEWPADYAERVAGKDCKLCDRENKGPNDWIRLNWLLVWEGTESEVYLEKRATRGLAGYSVALWKGAHIAEPGEASDESARRYWREVTALARAVHTVFQPVKLNISSMGSITPHLHTYVFPRHDADPAPGRNIPWRSLYLEPRFTEEELQSQAVKLRGAIEQDPLLSEVAG